MSHETIVSSVVNKYYATKLGKHCSKTLQHSEPLILQYTSELPRRNTEGTLNTEDTLLPRYFNHGNFFFILRELYHGIGIPKNMLREMLLKQHKAGEFLFVFS